MVETDSPYLLPRDLDPQPRSRRNEPMHLPHVVRRIAQLRGEDWSDVAAASTLTAETFFGLTPRAAPAES
jgi:TatD DNase family protein